MAGQRKSLAGIADEVSRTLQEATASPDRADRPAKDDSAARPTEPARAARRVPVPQQAAASDMTVRSWYVVHAEGLGRAARRADR
jgi:hypothetical protein